MMNLSVFYHIWVDGAWEEPLAEFLSALDTSDCRAPLYIGAVGSEEGLERLKNAISRDCCMLHVPAGWEQVTLDFLHAYAKRHDGAVLYAHDKGSYRTDVLTTNWRRRMTESVILSWRKNLEALSDCDAVGWIWLDRRMYWEPGGFLGNFWMANCDYIRTLPRCDRESRAEAEVWLGQGSGRMLGSERWEVETGPEIFRLIWPIWRERWKAMADGNFEDKRTNASTRLPTHQGPYVIDSPYS